MNLRLGLLFSQESVLISECSLGCSELLLVCQAHLPLSGNSIPFLIGTVALLSPTTYSSGVGQPHFLPHHRPHKRPRDSARPISPSPGFAKLQTRFSFLDSKLKKIWPSSGPSLGIYRDSLDLPSEKYDLDCKYLKGSWCPS